ncbi:MAG: hypothetical protein E7A50_04675 [Clostridiales bacterium]|nr:hypothetical protein [Clostridiales bacterium]
MLLVVNKGMVEMLELLLGAIASLGIAGAQDVLTSAGESAVKNLKESHAWKKVIVGTGEFFIKNEQEESSFFDDLELVLSKENLSKVAKDLKTEDGYDLQHKLYKAFMQLMSKYEIPYEIAESYTMRIMYAMLEQLRTISPQKYEHYFLQEWRDEQEKSFSELQNRIDKMSNELAIYNREQVAIVSSGMMDVGLRRSTHCPSIGIEFFIIDDEHFQDKFEDLRYGELVFIRGRSREETVYCILNELWRLNDKRPIYIIKNLESWKKLQAMGNEGNVYIPWFYADEIVAIENNTNIFVIDENIPVFGKSVLELRPRTHDTLSKCLQEAGLEYNKAYSLLSDTHGLYSQMKKQIFRGEYLRSPAWMSRISEKAKKTCLLIGSWEEIEGDKLIIESLYEDSYDKFIEEVLPYAKGEDPLLYMVKRNGSLSYYLASIENIWSYLNVLTNEKIWQSFIAVLLEVINESEDLFTYDSNERLFAQFKGERLFWSGTIRKGMLKTLLIKGAYQNDEETQLALNKLVENILKYIKTEKQWIYISKFWQTLCEISPVAVIKRIEEEWDENTGLLSLFQNQSNNFILERNSYTDILWGIEQLITQKEFFWSAFRWLLKLDSQQFEYKSNSPKDTFEKVFCTWVNFSSLQTSEEKIEAAKIAFKIDCTNTWEYLFSAIDYNGGSIFGELSTPKYREHYNLQPTTIAEMKKTQSGYLKLLMEHMDFSVKRWEKILKLSSGLTDELRRKFFEQLSYELSHMSNEEVMQIKNEIRHLIYRHRYFASSDWSMPEDKIVKYEKFLNEIHINISEYEYSYLFKNSHDDLLLNPVPYDREGNRNENEKAKEKLIKEKILEFQTMNYDLSILAKICANDQYSLLGRYLARYWSEGKWDYAVFKCLLEIQASGQIALDYLSGFNDEKCIDYSLIIEDLTNSGYSVEILASVYRIEAFRVKSIPLVTKASESIKKEFWKNYIHCDKCNDSWVLKESKKYATLDVYLDQVHQIHYRRPLSAEKIFDCFSGIEKMPYSRANQMTSYHIEQLISVIQDAYIDDSEKCNRISQIEIFFMGLLEWDNMKCFHRIIKQSPELLAQLVAVIFKKDHGSTDNLLKDQKYLYNMYSIYDKAHFCPAEIGGEVDETNLEDWIKKYKDLLIENDQESLFTSTLGRVFSFSPLGDDGHEPCNAVRKMIEKYGDDKMINSYQIAVSSRRGLSSPSAGKEELKIANEFKKNAEYLESLYPKTATIFYNLFEHYKRESKIERLDAENGWY